MPRGKASEEPLLSAEDVVGPDARMRVPLAGLLAHEPELREAQLSREEWAARLQSYLFPGPPEDAPEEEVTVDPDAS